MVGLIISTVALESKKKREGILLFGKTSQTTWKIINKEKKKSV